MKRFVVLFFTILQASPALAASPVYKVKCENQWSEHGAHFAIEIEATPYENSSGRVQPGDLSVTYLMNDRVLSSTSFKLPYDQSMDQKTLVLKVDEIGFTGQESFTVRVDLGQSAEPGLNEDSRTRIHFRGKNATAHPATLEWKSGKPRETVCLVQIQANR